MCRESSEESNSTVRRSRRARKRTHYDAFMYYDDWLGGLRSCLRLVSTYIKHSYLCLERCFFCVVLIIKGGRGIKGRGYVVNQYVIGNKLGKAAGTWEHREKTEGNKDPPSPPPPGRPSLTTVFTILNCLESSFGPKATAVIWEFSILSNILELQWCLPNKRKTHSRLSAMFTCRNGKGGELRRRGRPRKSYLRNSSTNQIAGNSLFSSEIILMLVTS